MAETKMFNVTLTIPDLEAATAEEAVAIFNKVLVQDEITLSYEVCDGKRATMIHAKMAAE